VLIVHLQRIIFNFDKFENDKINQHFDFPQQLDLKPYSYYEVMNKENRLSKPADGGDDEEDGQVGAKAPKEDKGEGDDDENQQPEEEDCFEYKLVGVTVHSGDAYHGHYWSYINTNRA